MVLLKMDVVDNLKKAFIPKRNIFVKNAFSTKSSYQEVL